MRIVILSIFVLTLSQHAFAQTKLNCTHYVYQEMPFITISMNVKSDGHIERLAEITHYGNTRQTAVEENAAKEGELYNLTIEADHPNSELFLEIYQPNTSEVNTTYTAKLINPESPAMREMPGKCESMLK